MPSPYELTEVMTAILGGIQDTLYYIATAIADNASVIATVVVVGALAMMVMKYGTKIFRGATGWLKGIF